MGLEEGGVGGPVQGDVGVAQRRQFKGFGAGRASDLMGLLLADIDSDGRQLSRSARPSEAARAAIIARAGALGYDTSRIRITRQN